MNALVIYDLTGFIWLIAYDETTQPEGIPSMFVTIPNGATLKRINVALNPHVPVFDYSEIYYADQIEAGLMTIDNVPDGLKTATILLLKERGIEV